MKFTNKIIRLSVFSVLAAAALPAFAGGFGIGTQSGSGTGNAFAGGAAVADDASVVWSNPAGMTALPLGKHVTGALHIVRPSFKFTNTGSAATLPVGTGNGGDGGDWAYIPNGFFAMDISPSLRFGVAFNVPFGLTTEYDTGWHGQLTALKSEIKTININPSLAYKVNDNFSIGGGVSIQRIEAELTAGANLAGTNIFKLGANDVGYGFNIGATLQPSPATRIGLHYRSSIKYKLDGSATFSLAPAGNGPVTADLRTPDSASVSVLHQVSPKLELMGDVTWTKWSNLQQLVVQRTSGAVLTNLLFRWEDTWRVGVGANYKVSDQTKLRFGLAYDRTPTNDIDRTPRLPDQNRTWLAFGVQYKPSKQGILDIGYAHEFVKDAAVNTPTAAGNLVGNFKVKADIFSIQYSHLF
ncbi:MAG: outer membrane protein transport protein [Burkholderiales bacterium]